MKNAENTQLDQSRWNQTKGKRYLSIVQDNPEKFIVDPTKLPQIQIDLIEEMPSIENKEILEFGSGQGKFSVALAKLGAKVTAIDIGEDLIRLGKRVATVNNVKCEFIVGRIEELQFKKNTFDFVVGNAVLHHLSRKAIIKSLNEAYRVLKPHGLALFTEPIENSKIFDCIQNLVPVVKTDTFYYRPSILQRAKFKAYLEEADDRDLSINEFIDAKGSFREVEFSYYGLLIRLTRVFPNLKLRELLDTIDSYLTHKDSPIKTLSQQALVIYRK